MSNTFKQEVKTIEMILRGSQWAARPELRPVLDEYRRVVSAGELNHRERRPALQVLFSSRAIDTFLAIIIRLDCAANHRPCPNTHTIGSSLRYLRNTGINGNTLNHRTWDDLDKNVLKKRNKYLHEAGQFPTQLELNRFLSSTVNGIRVISHL